MNRETESGSFDNFRVELKKETTLLSPPRSRRAKVTRSRVSTLNEPQIRLAAKT
jgi:hypothetical protein